MVNVGKYTIHTWILCECLNLVVWVFLAKLSEPPDPHKLEVRWSFLFQLFMLRGLDFSPRFCEIPTAFSRSLQVSLAESFLIHLLESRSYSGEMNETAE